VDYLWYNDFVRKPPQHIMNTNPTTIVTHEVNNLEFICITDHIRPEQYVEWEVEFTYQGKQYVGFLGGCPHFPSTKCDEFIVDAEPIIL